MNALLDKDFLKELDNYNSREIYARITALTVNELPIESIEGRVTGGSINIDGASAVRRTCSLSLVAQGVDINNFYWGLNNKFKLEIGLKNFINPKYPDIIWFPQGIYVITGFNTSSSVSNFNISINGKDKMCLLNGEVGGSIPMSVDFGVEEIVDGENTTYKKIPIKTIIREMLHTYALEPYHNIIINDLDDKGLELLEYRGEDPLYLAYNVELGEYTRMDFDGKTECYLNGKRITLEEIPESEYNYRIDDLTTNTASKVTFEGSQTKYTISKVEYGQTAGYRLTELTYAGDLISNIGESITSILDKITKMFGNFEYFYDLDGRFIFQAKKTYVNTSWSPVIEVDEDMYVENAAYADQNTYYFTGNNLISALSNAPNWNNVRNDYAIWGTRKSVTGAELPVHFRYAIHKKPEYYKAFDGTVYDISAYDWRELIYQMALDYFKHNQEDDFYTKLIHNNPNHYPTGITGYEQFYSDIQGFWRQMYDPHPKVKYYQYYYGSGSDKEFIPVTENKETLTELFVCETYQKLSSEDKDVDKMKVMALREYDGELELHPLIDTIPINYIWGNDGKQIQEDKYYITANNEAGYKEITKSFYERVDKKEIYVRRNNAYVHILTTVNLDDNCYLKTELDEDNPISIFSLPEEIQSLYYSKEKNKFNKYYLTSQIGIDGNVIPNTEKTRNYLTYYMSRYDFFRLEDSLDNMDLLYWNKNVKENTDQLNFCVDFLDTNEGKIKINSLTKEQYNIHQNILFYENENLNLIPLKTLDWDTIQRLVKDGKVFKKSQKDLGEYSISAIGDRPKVVNDSNVKSIYYRNVPNLIFTTNLQNEFKEKSGYIFMQISKDISLNYFNISAQGKSAKDLLDELLYQHSYCTNSINITAIPVYYLQPNTMIYVRDDQSKINGEYVVNRISLPLTYNGQMSISATKAPQRFN